jgi:hypothetical protein
MKIGEVTAKINEILSTDLTKYSDKDRLTTTRLNGYCKLGLIRPAPKKLKGKAYNEFKEYHVELILKAYRKIVENRMRTRDAFEQAYKEFEAPTLL